TTLFGSNHHGRTPDLPAGFDVKGECPLSVDRIHHTVVDDGGRPLAPVIHHARVPDSNETLHVGFVDLLERAVALPIVAHALGGDILGISTVVEQVLHR